MPRSTPPPASRPSTLATVRRGLLLVLLISMVGVGTELLLLKHYEDANQIIPLALLGLGLIATTWQLLGGSVVSLRVLQITMLLFVTSAPIGLALHYEGNAEFQREIDPTMGGQELFWKVMGSQSPPALAPGAMAPIGLLGLLYTYRYPALAGSGGWPPAPNDDDR